MQQLDGPNRNSKCVILYVEDSDAMAYMLQKALEQGGHSPYFRLQEPVLDRGDLNTDRLRPYHI